LQNAEISSSAGVGEEFPTSYCSLNVEENQKQSAYICILTNRGQDWIVLSLKANESSDESW
jgi:hypothetical protein